MSRRKNHAPTRGEDMEQIAKELARAEGIPLHAARSRVRSELQKRAASASSQHRPTIPARPMKPAGQPRNDNGLTLAEWMARSNWSPSRPVDEAERRWAANQPAGDRLPNPVPVEPPKAAKPKLAKLSEKQLRQETLTASKHLKAKSKAARDKASRQVCWLLWEGNRRGINLRPEADAHVSKSNPVVAKRPQPPRRGNPLYHIPMIEDGMAEALHLTAWADAEEEAGRLPSGVELSTVAPPVTPQARQRARELVRMIERENGHSIDDIFHAALAADGISQDAADEWAEKFGYYTAMQALNAGVSWGDDHTEIDNLRVPRIEFHYLDKAEYSEDPEDIKREAGRLPNPSYGKDFPFRATYWDPNMTGEPGHVTTYAKTYDAARAWLRQHAQPCWTQEVLSGETPRKVLWLSDREICEMARLLEGHGYDPDDASALYLRGEIDSPFKLSRALQNDPASLGLTKKLAPAPAAPAKKGRPRKHNPPCGCDGPPPAAGMAVVPKKAGKPDWNATELSAADRELVARIIAKAPIQTPQEQIDQRLRAALKKKAESPLGLAVRSYAREIVSQRVGAPASLTGERDDEVLLLVDGESFSTLAEFLEQNEGLFPQDVAAVRALQIGETYYAGGGAAATWSVERLPPGRASGHDAARAVRGALGKSANTPAGLAAQEAARQTNPASKDANLSAHQFMAVLRDQLQVGDRHVAMVNKQLGMVDAVSVTFVNLPADIAQGNGAEAFNNRVSWMVEGFDPKDPDAPAPKGKVSAKVITATPELRKAHPMRAKSGSPAAIAAYLAGIFQVLARDVPPRFTHTKRQNPARGARRTGFRVVGYDGDYKAHSLLPSATSHRIDQTFGNERAARDAATAWAASSPPQPGGGASREPYLFIEHVAARSAPRTIARWIASGTAWRQER